MAVNYCFTLNNPTLDEESFLQVTLEEVVYITYGRETGESGTPHLQGYLELSKKMSVVALKKLLKNPRLHLEARRGTQAQAIEYCHKDDADPYSRGTKKATGRPKVVSSKNKILPYVADIKGQGLSTFASHPDASFHLLKHAKEFVSLTESPRSRSIKPFVSWYHGPTGTGKTLRAFNEADEKGLVPYVKSGASKWFDGYDGDSFVIFDDFRDSHLEFGFLLRLLDRYPMRVELKGSSRQWKATRIIITSPSPPEECYKTMQATDRFDKISQLLRRIDEVVHVTRLPTPPRTPSPKVPTPPRTPSPKLLDSFSPIRMMYPVQIHSPFCITPNLPISEDAPRRRLFDSQTPLRRCPARPRLPSPTQLWVHPEFPAESQE